MPDASGYNEQVAARHLHAYPSVLHVAHVEVAGAETAVAHFIVAVEVFLEEVMNLIQMLS